MCFTPFFDFFLNRETDLCSLANNQIFYNAVAFSCLFGQKKNSRAIVLVFLPYAFRAFLLFGSSRNLGGRAA